MYKTVGLLTIDSHIYNYGGILQEYALQNVIKQLGYNCEIINYLNSSEHNTFSLKRGINNFSFNKINKRLISKIESIQNIKMNYHVNNVIIQRHKAFDDFREEKMILSKPCKFPELKDISLNYYAVICGSDQIWNPNYNIPSFFLNFLTKPTKGIIYAASIGKESLSSHELKIYKRFINNIDALSVREYSAKKILDNQNIKVVLDPTLLIEKSEWNKIAGTKQEYNNYIFCYNLENNIAKRNAVKKLANKYNLNIISIPYLLNDYNEADENFSDIEVFDAGPQDFLNLIKNASIIITDSYHATIFSIIFEKLFWVFGRKSGSYNMNTRIDTLLSYFNLNNRLIYPDELKNKQEFEPINYNYTNLNVCIKSSFDFLTDAINGE